MKWLKSRALRKQKLQVRRNPKPPESPKPEYHKPKQPKRLPKIEQPSVRVPFVGQSALEREATSPKDLSVEELRVAEMNAAEHGGIAEIKWNLCDDSSCNARSETQNPKPDGTMPKERQVWSCPSMGGSTWNSVAEFLAGRNMAVSPGGDQMGIFGYTHPGCRCSLTVVCEDGEQFDVGPYA